MLTLRLVPSPNMQDVTVTRQCDWLLPCDNTASAGSDLALQRATPLSLCTNCVCVGCYQDTWVIHEGLAVGSNALFAVFDGHGTEGEKCSRHVASHLPSMLVHSPSFKACPFLCCLACVAVPQTSPSASKCTCPCLLASVWHELPS